MDSLGYNGVRAEPRFLRDPTSLESISSGISKISSYVSYNLSKRRSGVMPNPVMGVSLFEQQQQQQQQQQEEIAIEEEVVLDEERNMDTVTFASFDKLNDNVSCLLLGYQDGFQLWDVTSPDNVHEICSIRDKETFGIVSCIHLLRQTEQDASIVIATEKDKKSRIIIYSLKTYSILSTITEPMDEHSPEDDTMLVTCIKSKHKIIALGCLSRHKSSIHLLSAITFKPITSPLVDVYHDIYTGPIFTLGSRFIAYATNTAVLNSDPVMTSFSNKLQVEKDVKGAAKDIAKEVVSGMKTLGEFSYQRLSNYFGNNYNMPPNTAPPQLMSHIPINDKESSKKTAPSGMVMIRDIHKLPSLPTRNISNSAVAHFRPHTHPISCLNFNPSGTLLLSASKQGHTFHIFSILTHTRSKGNVSHLYSLSRGFTDAQVEDCQFSNDSNWCAISTARGTSHIYAINPYGGKPEISGHVHSKVNNSNPIYYPVSKMNPKASSLSASSITPTTLGSVARIKQRRRMPEIPSQEEMYNNYGSTSPHHPSLPPLVLNRLQKEPRAKLTTSFVNASKSPYFVNSEIHNNDNTISIKQQATNMLKHIPYLPQQQQQQQQQQTPSSDTLVFGFDEEYDDATKMMNDEIGYQDIYTFHPSGILTLHRCWVAKMAAKKRENGRQYEKLDLSLKKESVAEWKVARNSDWDPVQIKVEEKKPEKPEKRKLFWLSNAEITTFSLDEPPIWSHRQFIFQTFKQGSLNSRDIPATETLVMPKEMPEPVSSRVDRVKKTTTRIADDTAEENMEDALAELEDNISKAMQTSFSPTESMGNSPATAAKWLSTSANAISAASPSKLFTDKNSSISFEDAYLINMGSGPSPEPSMHGSTPMQHSRLIQLDDDINHSLEEETIRFESDGPLQNDLYSPDGDNEVARPYESIFEGFHMQQEGSDSFPWN